MTRPEAVDYHNAWLQNAERTGVPSDVVAEIARRHSITPDSFAVLLALAEINDPAGKSFFLIPRGTSGDDARRAALMTYILNAGTGYGTAGSRPASGLFTTYPSI